MLVSVDFYNSDYIQDEEFTRAKQKFDRQEALLVPVLVRHCPWKSYELIRDLQALPAEAEWEYAARGGKQSQFGR